jgi:hypothetical protein
VAHADRSANKTGCFAWLTFATTNPDELPVLVVGNLA